MTQLAYLGICVSDLAAWRDVAGPALDMQESGSGPNGSLLSRIDGYDHRFEPIPSGADDLQHTAWGVTDADATLRVTGLLRVLGTDVREGSTFAAIARWVIGLIGVQDPNDLDVEAYYGPFL